MSKLFPALITIALISASGAAFAMDAMKDSKGAMMDMSSMDANHDGMVSKKEFMQYHEHMWSTMKKNSKGMVDMSDMQMMNGGMKTDNMAGDKMKGDAMMKDNMKSDGMMKDNMKSGGAMKDKAGK